MDANIVQSITTQTGDLTIQNILIGIGGLALLVVCSVCMYMMYKRLASILDVMNRDTEMRLTAVENEIYLDNVYTSYKAGLVIKTAEEEKVTLTPRPAEPEMNIAQTLKEQVKTEIQN